MKKADKFMVIGGLLLLLFLFCKDISIYNKLKNEPTFAVGRVIDITVNRTDYIDYEFQTKTGTLMCGSISAKRKNVKVGSLYLVVYYSENPQYNYLDFRIPLENLTLGDTLNHQEYKDKVKISFGRIHFKWIPFVKSRCKHSISN